MGALSMTVLSLQEVVGRAAEEDAFLSTAKFPGFLQHQWSIDRNSSGIPEECRGSGVFNLRSAP
jgi:hypothetical protein